MRKLDEGLSKVCQRCNSIFMRPKNCYGSVWKTKKFCSYECFNSRRTIRYEAFEEKYIPEPNSGCWIWMGSLNAGGYGEFRYGTKSIKAHRYSFFFHKGPISHGKFLLHSCDMRSCVNPDHLRVGSHVDNMSDMVKRGRSPRGERAAKSKLTNDQVQAIRVAKGNYNEIADRFGIGAGQARRIILNEHWKHLPWPQSAGD